MPAPGIIGGALGHYVCIPVECRMQVDVITQGPRMRKQRGPVRFIDKQIEGHAMHGYTLTNEGIFLNGVASGGAFEDGRCVGRQYTMTSVEIRLAIQMADPSGEIDDNLQMQDPGSYDLIPVTVPTQWVNGTGPDQAIVAQIPGIRYPYPALMGYCIPFRLLLVLDKEPWRAPTSGLLLQDVLNLGGLSIQEDGAAMMPFDEEHRDRFIILHDEVVNPVMQPEVVVHRIFNFKEKFGRDIPVTNKLNNVSHNGGVLENGLWLFGTSFSNPTAPAEDPYPEIRLGSSRLYYYEGFG